MQTATTRALVDRLAGFDRVVEVGVGHRPGVAAGLATAGVAVTATDVRNRPVPEGVRFVRDDVTDPDPRIYSGADAVFARNLPPDLHRPARDVAHTVDAPLLFTTLGGDPTTVSVDRETLPRTTLFVADSQPP